jgi:tetratricopeptide (TPR) repeat protein
MKISTAALGVVLGLSAASASAQYGNYGATTGTPQPTGPVQAPPAQPQHSAPSVKPSNKALKAIAELQQAVNNKDVANIPAKVAAAQAVAQTKEDHYLIGILQRQAALAANDTAALAQAVEAVVNSGLLDAKLTSALYLDLGAKQYNAKQYPQAVASFQRATALTPNDPQALDLLAQGMAAAGQGSEAAAAFQRAIAAQVAAGQKPEEGMYKRAVSAAYEANSPAAVDIGRQWIVAYPSPNSWRNAIAVYRNYTHPDVESTLDLLRLMQAAGALSTAGDYQLFITSSAEQLNYNEAQAVLDAGVAAKVIDPASAEFRDVAIPLKAKPKATAADLAAAAKTAQSGMALLRIGDRYYGMGDYAKAAELYRQAMGKAGVDPAVANLHLGMALARSGDKAGATAAFNAVTGPRADVAKYWLLYVNQKA